MSDNEAYRASMSHNHVTDYQGPKGVVLHDERTDELVTDRKRFHLADGSVLRLRLARGVIEDETEPEPPPDTRDET